MRYLKYLSSYKQEIEWRIPKEENKGYYAKLYVDSFRHAKIKHYRELLSDNVDIINNVHYMPIH